MGVSEDSMSIATYNDVNYFKCTMDGQEEFLQLYDATKATALIHITNGYMYAFTFIGPESSIYYSDFEDMMESVTY